MGLPSSVRRHFPMASKFSSENPIGSMILWQVAQGSLARCISICWRMVGLVSECVAEASSLNFGTLGGGSGGLTPRKIFIMALPRTVGEVRFGYPETVSKLH